MCAILCGLGSIGIGGFSFLVGCGESSVRTISCWTSSVSAQSPESQSSENRSVTTVTTGDTTPETLTRTDMERRMASPELAVNVLMDAIQRDDRRARNEMFSNQARRNLERTRLGWELTPGTTLDFSIGTTEYLSEKSARVACTLTESDSDGTRTRCCDWILRQEPVRGWRITGVSIPAIPHKTSDVAANPPTMLLDFEQMEETLLRIAAMRQAERY